VPICERTFPARAEHVSAARSEVSDLARRSGVPEDMLAGIRLAVSEAVANAVLHGYRDGARGDVRVRAEAHDHRLDVVVADAGCGMSPHLGSAGAGMGLPLIAELSDTMSVEPAEDGSGTVLCMTFRLPVAVAA
jgi:anti-sigma regulatory factor (Ser/Thr protein kinase)